MKDIAGIRELVAAVEVVALAAKRDAFDAWLEDTADEELAALRDETDALWRAANHARWFTMPTGEVNRRLGIRNA